MSKQLQEYSNTETNTQYKYTTADKALSESIKEQIGTMAMKVKGMIQQQRMSQNSVLLGKLKNNNK